MSRGLIVGLVLGVMVVGVPVDAAAPEGMMLIPGGEFDMGDHHDGMPDALPVHAVYVNSFYMDVYEVTNQRYCAYLNSAYPSQIKVDGGIVYSVEDTGNSYPYFDTDSADPDSQIHFSGGVFTVTGGKEAHPVREVSWYGAAAMANWRSMEEGRTPCYNLSTWACDFGANGYRLPTEAEWEYAARAGNHDPYYRYPWGDTASCSDANYEGCVGETVSVGSYAANAYGLYDVAGNVYEWCNDWYAAGYYEISPYDNPQGSGTGTSRVLRGGSWNRSEEHVRCAHRYSNVPAHQGSIHGFRLALAAHDGMMFIAGAEFEMGDHHGDGDPDELPVHAVYVDSFYIGVYEVTNQRYCDYLNSAYPSQIKVDGGIVYSVEDTNNSYRYCDTNSADPESQIHFSGGVFTVTGGKEAHPVREVSWYGAAAMANWRSTEERRTPCYNLSTWACDFGANGYRLPTEAEWEYAARAGNHDPYYRYPWGDTASCSDANYEGCVGETVSVGSYAANAYGLYDVAGNVYEWCNDWYAAGYYEISPYDNPQGPATGTHRVVRGGAWDRSDDHLRCAYRHQNVPDAGGSLHGFRLALGWSEPPPVPTLSEWGLIAMTLLVLTTGTLVYTRRRLTLG